MAEGSTAGELTEKNSSFKEVSWTINKFFDVSSEPGYKIRSPAFHFVGVNCNLSACPNGSQSSPSEIIISLFLRMVYTNYDGPPVICEIGLRSNDGTLVKSSVTEKNLMNGMFMSCNFSKSKIMANKELLGPEKSLTIVCKLTIRKNSRKEEASQTGAQVKSSNGDWFFAETCNKKEIAYPREVYVQTEQRCMGLDKLLHDFKNLLSSGDESDVTIKVKENEFKVHRAILGARTPVFAAMFKHDMSEKNTGNVPLDDCEPDIFRDFLHYVYTGTADSLSSENVFGLYELSHKYQLDDLKEECLYCLKEILSVDTICDIITLALKFDERELLRLATTLFCEKMNEIIITVKWQAFMCGNPTYVNELLIKRMEYELKRVAGSG